MWKEEIKDTKKENKNQKEKRSFGPNPRRTPEKRKDLVRGPRNLKEPRKHFQ